MTTEARKEPMSKSYAPSDHEARIWDKWIAANAFHADPNRVLDGDAQPYCILIPPPNVTAALHLGHALNNSIQDILIRAHRMKGYETLWMPGTDHAGIATQTMVDRKLKKAGQPGIADYKKKELAGEPGREEFLKLVHDFKDEYQTRITHQLQRMGCSCDWERQRFTMDDICARAVREAFFQLFKDGLIYRGKRLVNWDPVTQTALADDEVENEEVDGYFYYLRYPLVQDNPEDPTIPVTWGELVTRGYPNAENHPEDEQAWVTVATTRPETYMGDTGVAINPKDPRAAAVRGFNVMLPLVGRIIPIIEDDYVVLPVQYGGEPGDAKAEMSTGFLKVTPAHDPNDWMIGQRHSLEPINIMAPDASISDQHGWEDIGDGHIFVGKSREEARTLVIEEFKSRSVAEGSEGSLLERMVPYRHSVGHSYRSHAAIEPYLSDQWYCKVSDDKLRGNAQRALAPEQRTEASLEAWPESAPGGPARRAGSPPNQLKALQSIPEFAPQTSLSTGLLHKGIPHTFTPCDPFPKGQRAPSQLDHTKRNLPHLQLPNATYFVTWRTMDGITLSGADSECLIKSIEHRHGDSATVDALVIMPDHVHMLVRMNDQNDLCKWISDLKRYTARTINSQSNRTGSLWQDEHFDRIVRDENEYVDHLTYIVDNPIKAELTKHRHEWPHCLLSESVVSALTGVSEEPGSASRATEESTDGSMSFFPARYAKTYETWHDNLRDWCISRQLWWGHRIPVWNKTTPWKDVRDNYGIFELIEYAGNSFTPTKGVQWIEATSKEQYLGLVAAQMALRCDGDGPDSVAYLEQYICVAPDNPDIESMLEKSGWTQDPDVLDTWFSSALWPLSTMGWPDAAAAKDSSGIEDFESMLAAFNPTSVLTTAREIITLWVSRMTMFNRYFLPGGPARRAGSSEPQRAQQEPGSANRATEDQPGPAPFKDVFIHAMIQDGEGRKMSKSLGNGVDPLDIIHSHGADAMRFTLCQMTTQTQDVRMPVELDEATGKNTSPKFDLGRNLCNKLWNAAKFSMMMLEKNPVPTGVPIDPQELTLIDRWMLSRVVDATNKINAAQRNYMFKDYADTLYDLFWRDFCDWYLESIKPTIAENPNQRAVLRLVFEAILRLMHPVMPFITETLSEQLADIPLGEISGFNFAPTKSNQTLCQSGWPEPENDLLDAVAEEAYERVRSLVSTIREIRAQSNVAPKRKIVLHASGSLAEDIARWSPLVETLAGVESISGDAPDGQSASFTFEGSEYQLSNLADALDAGAEKDRLEKELAGIEKSIKGIQGRLSNPGYTDKAPAHLVQQTRDQLAGLEKDRDATKSALDKLG
jgi:valyl-tRNA synthetase